MSFDLVDVFRHMQPFAIAIVAVLAVMALASISVTVERLWVYWRSRRKSRQFAHQASALLQKRDFEGLIKMAKSSDASHLAVLIADGMKAYTAALREPGELPALELAKRELDRKAEMISADVRRGHSVLASVGSIGPFVGLLGTVIGLIHTFGAISVPGMSQAMKQQKLASGIAEAMYNTAFGLGIAVTCMIAHVILHQRAKNIQHDLDATQERVFNLLTIQTRPAGY